MNQLNQFRIGSWFNWFWFKLNSFWEGGGGKG